MTRLTKEAKTIIAWLEEASLRRELLPWNVIDETGKLIGELAAKVDALEAELKDARAKALNDALALIDKAANTHAAMMLIIDDRNRALSHLTEPKP